MQIDKKVIKLFQKGDSEAFDAIYHHYSKRIYIFSLGLVKDQGKSKDLVQEVFLTLWEKRDQVNPDLNFDNYIFTISYNSIRKFFRKKSVEDKVIADLRKNTPENIGSTEATFIATELLVVANKTIESLPTRRKAVYKLNKQEGLEIKEIADRLNISVNTARNHLAKSLKYLKEELSDISLPMLLFFFLFLKILPILSSQFLPNLDI